MEKPSVKNVQTVNKELLLLLFCFVVLAISVGREYLLELGALYTPIPDIIDRGKP